MFYYDLCHTLFMILFYYLYLQISLFLSMVYSTVARYTMVIVNCGVWINTLGFYHTHGYGVVTGAVCEKKPCGVTHVTPYSCFAPHHLSSHLFFFNLGPFLNLSRGSSANVAVPRLVFIGFSQLLGTSTTSSAIKISEVTILFCLWLDPPLVFLRRFTYIRTWLDLFSLKIRSSSLMKIYLILLKFKIKQD